MQGYQDFSDDWESTTLYWWSIIVKVSLAVSVQKRCYTFSNFIS